MNTIEIPQWVMIGVPAPDGSVELYASKNLTEAELRTVVDERSWQVSIWSTPPVMRSYELHVHLEDFTVINGPDYGSALRSLLLHWSPEPSEQDQLALP